MKTIKEIKDHFSMEEIKLLIEIVRGRQDFDIMETAIKDFYSDEINIFSFLLLDFNKFSINWFPLKVSPCKI